MESLFFLSLSKVLEEITKHQQVVPNFHPFKIVHAKLKSISGYDLVSPVDRVTFYQPHGVPIPEKIPSLVFRSLNEINQEILEKRESVKIESKEEVIKFKPQKQHRILFAAFQIVSEKDAVLNIRLFSCLRLQPFNSEMGRNSIAVLREDKITMFSFLEIDFSSLEISKANICFKNLDTHKLQYFNSSNTISPNTIGFLKNSSQMPCEIEEGNARVVQSRMSHCNGCEFQVKKFLSYSYEYFWIEIQCINHQETKIYLEFQ